MAKPDGADGEQARSPAGRVSGEHPRLGTLGVGGPAGSRLPDGVGRLVGRERELATVVAACRTNAVVTLIGPGGIGKTRLALAAAQAMSFGPATTWWVELADLADPADVEHVVADLDRAGLGGPGGSRSGRPALLVLDGCEHLVAAVAALVARLTGARPGLRVVATSREALGAAGERLVVVGPLEPATSGVELFEARAGASGPGRAAAERECVEELCRRLDGVPLAIELAAACAPHLGVRRVARELDDHLRLQSGGRRIGVERQRTLGATLRWSYEQLRPSDQALLGALSVVIGWFDAAAAEALVGGRPATPGTRHTWPIAGGDMATRLGTLVDRSLLVAREDRRGRRFRMPASVRELGADVVARGGTPHARAARHAAWSTARVEATARQVARRDALAAEEPPERIVCTAARTGASSSGAGAVARGRRVVIARSLDIQHADGARTGADLVVPPAPIGLVVFAHGSGSSRHSPRNRMVAERLQDRGLATLLLDLLTGEEDEAERRGGRLRFDVELLAVRLGGGAAMARAMPASGGLPVCYFGASTGAAAALIAAANDPSGVGAVVSRGGRPDLAGRHLGGVRAPTLLVVGAEDTTVLGLNREAQSQLVAPNELVVVAGATHLFEEPGALEEVARLAADWFTRHLGEAGTG